MAAKPARHVFKRIYINREAILENQKEGRLVRQDVTTVAIFDYWPIREDPDDQREGCDRGATAYASCVHIDIEGPSFLVSDPNLPSGATMWLETYAPVVCKDWEHEIITTIN